MKALWRPTEECIHLLFRHTGFDRKQVLVVQMLLTELRKAVTPALLVGSFNGMPNEKQKRQQGQHVGPKAALGKKGLLHFQANDRPDLRPPKPHHRTTSSLPI